jgi:hypothetical protein
VSHNRVGDAIRLIDLAPSGEFRSDLRAKLLAEFALQEAGSGGVTDLVAAPPPEPVEVYVTLTSDKSPLGLRRRVWKTVLAAAACLAVVATGVVIAHHDAQLSAPRDLRDVDPREAEPLAIRGLITPEVLGVAWVDGQRSPDTERPKHAAATIAAMPGCALLISAGLFPPTIKSATAYQFVDDGNFLGQRVFVYATAEDASAAMDVIAGDTFAACWFNLFDRIRVSPLVGAGKTPPSEAWNAPPISLHGDRQVIIGQHVTIVRPSVTDGVHLVNAFVQVGRTITWIDPRLPAGGDLSGVEKAITAATTALKNVSGS